jgi:hypothetical protein
VLRLLIGQVGMQHLDGCLQLQPYVLPEIHFGIAALPQQGDSR